MSDLDVSGQPVSTLIAGASAPAVLRRPGTLVEELTARLVPPGLPPDVQNIVDIAVRSGMGESDPNWIWLLPVLLRQVPAAGLRIEFEALASALNKKSVGGGEVTGFDNDQIESIVGSVNAMRGELQKIPRRISETLKPAVSEAVTDALEAAPGRVKVDLDDSKIVLAAREALVNSYVLAAIGFGAFSTVAAFILGSKFG